MFGAFIKMEFYLNNKIVTGFEPITMDGIEYSEFRDKPIDPLLPSAEFKESSEELRRRLDPHEKDTEYTSEIVKCYEESKKLALKYDISTRKRYRDMEQILMVMTEEFVRLINAAFLKNTGDMSVEDRRKITVQTDIFGLAPYLRNYSDCKTIELPETIGEYKMSYGEYIVEKLCKQKNIRYLRGNNGHGYHIQA